MVVTFQKEQNGRRFRLHQFTNSSSRYEIGFKCAKEGGMHRNNDEQILSNISKCNWSFDGANDWKIMLKNSFCVAGMFLFIFTILFGGFP
jgi:hypothetical protein